MIRDPVRLIAEDKRARARQVGVRIIDTSMCRRPPHRRARLPKEIERLAELDVGRYRHVEDGTRGCSHRLRVVEIDGRLAEHDEVRTGAGGAPDQRAGVAGVADAGKNQDKTRRCLRIQGSVNALYDRGDRLWRDRVEHPGEPVGLNFNDA